MYQKVSTNLNFTEREEATERFWEEQGIFAKTVETGAFVCEEREELRYIDEGDTLTLRYGEKTYSKKVIDAWAEKDLTEDERMALYMHEEGAEEKWRNAKKKLTVGVEGYKKPVFKGFEK